MFRNVFSRCLIVALMVFVLASSVYAEVMVTDPVSSTGEEFVVGVVEEEGLFWHDRAYLLTDVPEEYLGLTNIMSSADTVGDENVTWTFEIDQPAYVYIAFDERWERPENRVQNPENWFNDAFSDTGQIVVLTDPAGASWAPLDYWLYKSNEPYPAGTVTIQGLGQGGGDGVYRVTFLQGADMTAVSPQEKLAGRWGEIKSLK